MRHTQLTALTGILLLAALTRIYHIDLQSLWIDEGFTWNLTQYADPLWILQNDVHPPLYFLAMDIWVELVGVSQVAMRYFSVLPSLLSIAVVYQLGRELVIQRGWQEPEAAAWVPILAALLMALADSENYLAQEARSYTWHVLCACASMWGFLRWVRTSGQRWLMLWLLSTITLIYTFYLGAFVGVAQGLGALLLLNDSRNRRKLLLALGVLIVAAASLLPWILLTGSDQVGNASRAEVIRPEAYGFWLGEFRVRYFTGQWALMLGLCIWGLFPFKFNFNFNAEAPITTPKSSHMAQPSRINTAFPILTILLWLCVPLLLTLIINQIAPVYQPRRVSQIVPAIALLIAFGLGNIRQRERVLLVGIIIFYGLMTMDVWRFKQPWDDFATETVHLIAPETPIFFEVGGDDYAPRYHYQQLLGDISPTIGLTTWRNLEPQNYNAGMPGMIQQAGHLWLFYWSSDTGAMDWLSTFQYQRTATIQAEFNADVYLYRYDQMPEAPLAIYENGMVLHDVLLHEVNLVELLWSTTQPLDREYTTSVLLLDETGQVIAQHDSQPFMNQRPTTSWSTGDLIYDPKRVITPDESPISSGEYEARIVVYSATESGLEGVLLDDGTAYFSAGRITIK